MTLDDMIRDYVRAIVADALDVELKELRASIVNLRDTVKEEIDAHESAIDSLKSEIDEVRENSITEDKVTDILEREIPNADLVNEDDVRRIVDECLTSAEVSISVR